MGTESALADAIGQKDVGRCAQCFSAQAFAAQDDAHKEQLLNVLVASPDASSSTFDLCKALLAHHRTEKAFRALTAKLSHVASRCTAAAWQSLLERQQAVQIDATIPLPDRLAHLLGCLSLLNHPAAQADATSEMRAATVLAAQKTVTGCKSQLQADDVTAHACKLAAHAISLAAAHIRPIPDPVTSACAEAANTLLTEFSRAPAFRSHAKLAPLVTALLQGWQQHFDAAVAATPPDFASHVMALRFYTRKLVFGSRACPGCLEDSIPAITETIVTVLGRFPPNRELNRQEDDVKALVNVVLLPCSFLSRTLSHSKAFLLRLMAQSGVDGRSDGNASAALVCLCTAFHRAVKTEQSWLLDDEALVSTVITTILSCAGNCYAAMQRLIYKAGQEPTLTPLYSLVSNALVSAVLGCSVRHFAAIERAMFGHLTDARFFTRLLVHDMWLSLCPAFSLHVMENHIQLLVHMADEQRQRELEDQALSKPGKGKKGAHFALVPFTNRLIYRYVSSIGGDALALCSRFEASSVRSSAWRLVSFAPFAASCKADAILASALPSPVPPADDVVALADCALVIANFVPWLAASGLIEAHIMALDQAAKAHPANLSLQVAVAQLLSAMVSSPTFQNSPFVTSLFEHVIQASATLAGSGMLMAACHSLLVAFGHITLDDNAVAQLTTFVGNLASAATPESLVEFSLFVHLRAFAKATPNPQVLPTILGGESSPAFAKFTAILKQQPLVSTTRLLPADTETALSWIASKQQRLHRRSACRQGGSHETPKAILDSLQLALQSDPPAWFVAELRTMALRLPPNPR